MQANELNKFYNALKKKEGANSEAVQSAVNGLSGEQKARLEGVLSSPEKMKALLESDAARELMKKLNGNEG